MIAAESTQTVPISVHEDGSWKVTGSRVTVDVLLEQFRQGSTPEQIQDDFPTLSLDKIYNVIGYYLSNQQSVDDYLRERENEASQLQTQCESLPGVNDFRAKIRDARNRRASQLE